MVLVVLGLLVGIATPVAMRYLSTAKSRVARIQVENISVSLDLFRLDVGRYPTAEEGLRALVRRPPGLARWKGPYIEGREPPLDPWDKSYLYRLAPKGAGVAYLLRSNGADGVEGGEGEDADITLR